MLLLRKLRRERELTQAQLGKKMGLSHSTIAAIEAGRIKPSFATAIDLAQFFKTPVESLFAYIEVA